ncbi:Signal transduction histidine kinase [Desulfotomaculum arcticum]|uniref:histidine kinase n=1 Tax=Desulfotruncus arcticus DSM 17038 TaxID=1121424 RepID=A0A1I2VTU2_9FIRM|nr:HAMP domain-containing sensor histidine kinase [Desulfotruncus arcticus]SFG92715.1 Signal transduction histidine kinase [Desulfotomaculum arcticum] [Desulfotruncus arcticus DSM 17038]
MTAVQRFFRKYFLSTMGILLLFLVVNVVLGCVIVITAANNSEDSRLPIRKLAGMVTATDGKITATQEFSDTLAKNNAWAMLLNDSGTVIWDERMPDDLPRSYTVTQIAQFSRWYLQDYPVYVWEHPAGLFVIGYPKDSIVKYAYSTSAEAVVAEIVGPAILFAANILLMLILFWRNTHKVEKAVKPILTGIGTMAQGKLVVLPKRGELAEINTELNRAGEQLQKKDLARSEWINGISHDIRTPLSIILGYAGEIEDDNTLPSETQTQAGMIRRQAEKLRRLVADLNLASKLEYSMQPATKTLISPVELARQVMSDFINNGLKKRFALELRADAAAEKIIIEGDNALLVRMLENLIQNSVSHNPDGCNISITVGADENTCMIKVEDTGSGVSEPLLKKLNQAEISPSTQNEKGEAAHGMGLKLVKQITKVHQGKIIFSNAYPHGLTVIIGLPIHNRI